MVNVAETQPAHIEGRNKGADDAVQADRRGVAPGHFLKAPSSLTLSILCHSLQHTLSMVLHQTGGGQTGLSLYG